MKLSFMESSTVEFKREYTSDVSKTIIAFANTNGGVLYIGVGDDGSVVGVSDVDRTCIKVTNAVRGSIRPDLVMSVAIGIEMMGGKNIVKVAVQRGNTPPYYLREKGLTPQGVFVRHGTSSVPTTDEAFLSIIRSTVKEKYEESRSLYQLLTFKYAAEQFEAKELPFGEEQKKSLNIIASDGFYTNLGLLVSDQCKHTIKVSVFQDQEGSDVKSWREFSGSLLRQLDEVSNFLDLANNNRIEKIVNLRRVDKWDYPPHSIREALLNAIIHRDYALEHSTQIKVFSSRMEFRSFGQLVAGVTREDIMKGASALRNRNLADLFRRLNLIEAFGFGIPMIMRSYRDEDVQPTLEFTASSFIITLPNTHIEKHETLRGNTAEPVELSEDEHMILGLFDIRESITRRDVEKVLSVSDTIAKRRLRELIRKSIISPVGRASKTRYVLNKGKEAGE